MIAHLKFQCSDVNTQLTYIQTNTFYVYKSTDIQCINSTYYRLPDKLFCFEKSWSLVTFQQDQIF